MIEITEWADDGGRAYRFTEDGETCTFTIARRGHRTFGCSGINFLVHPEDADDSPFQQAGQREVIAICHEAGWLTTGWTVDRAHRACKRKVLRAARNRIRERHARRQLRPGRAAALERSLLDGGTA